MSLAIHHVVPSSVALLSAATLSDVGQAPLSTGGEPVLAHQVAALRAVGIRKFLIEVDSVPGALLAMADRLKQAGCSVDFIRSVQDLREHLSGSDTFVVQAERVYLASDFLLELMEQPGAFIATVDGRAENDNFERMDLNTRWSGFAVLPVHIVANIGELPDGWSMTSSLLRQAMQDGVSQQLLKQNHLQEGDLRRIDKPADAEKLAHDILARRAASEPGFIEAQIFAPIAAKLAPSLWRVSARKLLTNGLLLASGMASLGFAGLGWVATAGVASIAAVFINSVRLTLDDIDADRGWARWAAPAMWLLLAAALMLSSSIDAYQASNGVFVGGIVAGLAILSRQLRLPDWGRKTLQSPALVVVSILFLAPLTGISDAAKWVAALQLLLLIAAKWSHKSRF